MDVIRGVVKCNVCRDYVCTFCSLVKRCAEKGCFRVICDECRLGSLCCDDHNATLCQV